MYISHYYLRENTVRTPNEQHLMQLQLIVSTINNKPAALEMHISTQHINEMGRSNRRKDPLRLRVEMGFAYLWTHKILTTNLLNCMANM